MIRTDSAFTDSWKQWVERIGRLRVAGVAAALAALIFAGSPSVEAAQIVVVRNDPGGAFDDRMRLVQSYRQSGKQVEIRSGYCLSACTMYLGLSSTCVVPDAVFGFHGPSSQMYGISLPPAAFEHWSAVMAAHYPEPLKSWFLKNGRYLTVGFYKYSGRQLINIGIRECA
jgi:hypothetical protein